jgi:4-amino-4-deoxy-L-arabinose transferase-like glycosyltransferase
MSAVTGAAASQGAKSESERSAATWSWVVVFAALALRLGWWAACVRVIENEGVVYARLAQSLFGGDGMTGIFGGRDVMFPPLYPAAIGLVASLTGAEEIAGRLIGVLCGTALVAVLYRIGELLFDRKVALVIAALAAIHPMLIGLSTSLYSEGPWILLMTFALYCVLRSRAQSIGWLVAAGLAAGSAYLVRPEGMVFVGYLAFAVAVWSALQRHRFLGIRSAAVFLAAALVIGAPYVAYLSSLAGTFRWEGKSAYNNIQNERIRSGMTVPQAARGLDANGNAAGVFLNLHTDQAQVLRTPGAGTGSLISTLTSSAPRRAVGIGRQLLNARFLSAPWVIGIAAIGVFAVPWWRTRRPEGLIMLGVPLLQLSLLLSVDQAWDRYLFSLAPLLLLWAGAGVAWIARLVAQRQRIAPDRGRHRVELAVTATSIAGLALLAFGSVRALGDLTQAEDIASRDLGAWMARDAAAAGDSAAQPIIMGIGLAPVYYAHGTMRYLPHAPEAAALEYVRRMRPRYIVLREFEKQQVPYGAAWLERGIEDACAKSVRPLPASAGGSRLWRWDCGEAPR